MRTITTETKVYSFEELSEEGKEKAIDQWRQEPDYWFMEEANSSFEAFASIFNIENFEISYDEPYRNSYSIKLDDAIKELSGQRLSTYIWNNYRNDIFKGKYYGHLSGNDKEGNRIPISEADPIGKRHVLRYSKCQLSNNCVLTGVCYDNDLLTPIYDFLKNPKDTNFETLLNDCVYSLCHSVRSEMEYQDSEEAIIETIQCNEYEFTEDGQIF